MQNENDKYDFDLPEKVDDKKPTVHETVNVCSSCEG